MKKYLYTIVFATCLISIGHGQPFGDPGTSWEYCLMEDYEIPTSYFTKYTFQNIDSENGINQLKFLILEEQSLWIHFLCIHKMRRST